MIKETINGPLTSGIFKIAVKITSFLFQKSLRVHHTICRMSGLLSGHKNSGRLRKGTELECEGMWLQASLLYQLGSHFTKYSEQRDKALQVFGIKDFISLKSEAIYTEYVQKRAPCRAFPFINITAIN